MATYDTLTSLLTAIANAIRSKTGETNTINAQNFPSKILSILQCSGNAQPSDVLSGKTFTNDNGEQTGIMTNRGAWGNTINPGGSVTIPSGFHNGNGKVSAKNGSNPSIKYKNHSSAGGATSLSYTFDSEGKYRVCAIGHAEVNNGNQVEFYTNGSIVATHYSHMWSKGGGTYGGMGDDASGTGLVFWGDISASKGKVVKILTKETKSFVTLCVEKLSY